MLAGLRPQRRSVARAALLASALVLGLAGNTQAAPGDLDNSFGSKGKQATDFGADETAQGVAMQGDGKIVVVGYRSWPAGGGFMVARYNGDGSLDNSFSDDGKQTTDFGGGNDGGRDVAIQSDGKIVVAGATHGQGSSDGNFALARYNVDGSLDNSFSGDGKQTTDIRGGSDSAHTLAIGSDGKIVVAGISYPQSGGQGDFALARYNGDGSLDTSFSSDYLLPGDDLQAINELLPNSEGTQTTDFGGHDAANALAIQSDGKIVAAGYHFTADAHIAEVALARYNADGSLDSSFSGDGKQTADLGAGQTTEIGGGHDSATAVAMQSDGKIVVAGGSDQGASYHFGVARYNGDGSLDSSFSGDGKQTTDFGGSGAFASAIAIQGDGKIVAAGDAAGNAGKDFALARYNGDGSLDSSFSDDGKQTTDFGGMYDNAETITLQSDAKIIVAGASANGGDFALARYLGR
ncbi:MAG: hypothetical protein M3N47_13680 [Chloroflexota bacterium]|nr:hypothetical protein [Chloroflexota bacterium]